MKIIIMNNNKKIFIIIKILKNDFYNLLLYNK